MNKVTDCFDVSFIYNEIAWVILEDFLREKIQMNLRDLVNNLNASEA